MPLSNNDFRLDLILVNNKNVFCQSYVVWFIYQMIFAVYTIHEHFNIYHGNIRNSNFLLTNYHYLLLSDFAAYKPTYILQDT
jgi:hypothetical protein